MTKLLAVCTPTFNDQYELLKTLNSLENLYFNHKELFSECEFIVADNCSTDETPDLLEKYKSIIPIRVITQETNKGFRSNLERLASECEAKWILFVMSGDELSTEEFARLIETLRQSNASMYMHTAKVFDSRTGVLDSPVNVHTNDAVVPFSQYPIPIFRALELRNIIQTQPAMSGEWWPHVEWALSLAFSSNDEIEQIASPINSVRPSSGWWTKPMAYLAVIQLDKVLRGFECPPKYTKKMKVSIRDNLKSLGNWVYAERFIYGHSYSSKSKLEILLFAAKRHKSSLPQILVLIFFPKWLVISIYTIYKKAAGLRIV